MIEVTTPAEWKDQAEQFDGNYLIFKHSTTCPISANAYREIGEFDQAEKFPVLLVKVIESRPLSQQMAGDLLVGHASPQVILVKGNRPVWSATHYSITKSQINEALDRYLS